MGYWKIATAFLLIACSWAISARQQGRVYVVEKYVEKNAEKCVVNHTDKTGWLYANRWLGAGDFIVGAIIEVDRAGSSFEMGRAKEGIIFGDKNEDVIVKFGYPLKTANLGKFEDIIPKGYFTFNAYKKGLSIEYFINNKKIASFEFIEDYTENIGFFISENSIQIKDFWLEGDVRGRGEIYHWFYDDFESERVRDYPKNWYTPHSWLENSRDWFVEFEENNKFIRHKAANNAMILLHGFGKDTILEAAFKVNTISSNSSIWFALRHNLDPSYLVRCGYDFNRESWIIEESYGNIDLHNQVAKKMHLELNKWHNIRLEAWGEAIVIYLNDDKITNSNSLVNDNYGKIALYADNVDVSFDNVRYRSEGQVQLGVETHILRAPTINIFRPNENILACKVGGGWTYLSEDSGISWKRAQSDCPDINCIKLANDNLLSLKRHLLPDTKNVRYAAHISQDEGLSWSKPYWVHQQSGRRVAMNGKLTQSKNGRIFFACSSVKDVLGDDGSVYAEKVGGVEIYISDNNGQNWQMLKRLDFETTGLNLQEALIVPQNDGRYCFYARTPYGSLYSATANSQALDFESLVPLDFNASMCAFNIWYDDKESTSYLIWTYEDPDRHPMPQKPRERMSLARKLDKNEQWEYLCDVDDFRGHLYRFMNLGIFGDDDYIYCYAWVHGSGINTNINRITRFKRDELTPKPFAPLR